MNTRLESHMVEQHTFARNHGQGLSFRTDSDRPNGCDQKTQVIPQTSIGVIQPPIDLHPWS